MKKVFYKLFSKKEIPGSPPPELPWHSVKGGSITIHTDRAYDKFSELMCYDIVTQWRIGVMKRAMLIHIQEKHPGHVIDFDLSTRYRLSNFPVGSIIHWKPEYEKIKGKIDA